MALRQTFERLAGLWQTHAVEEFDVNPMQAAYNKAQELSGGEPVLYSTLLEIADKLNIPPADQCNLSGVTVDSLVFNQEGVEAIGRAINISGMTANCVTCKPYTTSAHLITGDEVTTIGELICVGHTDNERADVPAMSQMSIGRVTCVSEDGSAPHNISLAFENCAIGEICAEGSTHMQLSATNCFIEDANFKGSKALALDVHDGILGGCFDKISIAPISTGICNAQFNGTMQYAAGYTSLEDTVVANPEAFAGTNLANFETRGATIPCKAAEASFLEVDQMLEALYAAHQAAKPLGACEVAEVHADGSVADISLRNCTNQFRVAHEAPSLGNSSFA